MLYNGKYNYTFTSLSHTHPAARLEERTAFLWQHRVPGSKQSYVSQEAYDVLQVLRLKKKERKNVDAIMCTLSGSLKCVWQCLLCCSLGRRKRTAWRILPSVAPWSLCHGTDETIAPLRLYGVTLFLAHDRMTMACHTVCVSSPWDLLYTPGQ